MPRTFPMGYSFRPYNLFISRLEALDVQGLPLAVTDLDGVRWRIAASPDRPLATVRYAIDLDRMDREILGAGDASRARPGYLGLLGYSVLGFIDGLEANPVTVGLHVPDDWPAYSSLDPERRPAGALTVTAPDFLAAADAQYGAGPALTVRTLAAPVPAVLALYSEGVVDVDRLAALGERALQRAIGYFGAAPFAHYTIGYEILRPVSAAHDYLFSQEHLEGATFRAAAGEFKLTGADSAAAYFNLLHHIAHSWITERCAAAGSYPVTWDYPPLLEGVWFSEGWARYVAVDIVSGDAAEPAATRRRLSARWDAAAVDTSAPVGSLSTIELSLRASQRYSEDFRIAKAAFSRGALMAEAIDTRLRTRTNGRKTFRDVARGLVAWCAVSDTPVTPLIIGQVVQRRTGVVVTDIIDRWLKAPAPRKRAYRPRP